MLWVLLCIMGGVQLQKSCQQQSGSGSKQYTHSKHATIYATIYNGGFPVACCMFCVSEGLACIKLWLFVCSTLCSPFSYTTCLQVKKALQKIVCTPVERVRVIWSSRCPPQCMDHIMMPCQWRPLPPLPLYSFSRMCIVFQRPDLAIK